MSRKKRGNNERRFSDPEPPQDNRGEPVPGTGHDTKKAKQKMDKENRTSLANAKRCSNKISHGYFAPEIARFCGLF